MSSITTHVLDTSRGAPAVGVPVVLAVQEASAWRDIGEACTDADGRVNALIDDGALAAGTYRLRFDVVEYFEGQVVEAFYPHVEIVFTVRSIVEHYHVPLLLSPFGYSTYRGS